MPLPGGHLLPLCRVSAFLWGWQFLGERYEGKNYQVVKNKKKIVVDRVAAGSPELTQ